MIIQQDKVTVQTNIKKSSRATFGVKVDGKFFEMLIKNVYSNPILACLQELAQNAYDAHRNAGKSEVPFEVTLPNSLHPNLVVRDFGNSMTDEFMLDTEEGYSAAFASTKDQDANQAGGYGIGKLVALALSHTYTLACYSKGERRAYSIFRNSEGLPDIVRTNVRPTTEPDGVEVTVPVQTNDIYSFVDAAQRAFKYYVVRPKIRGVSGFEFPEIKKTLAESDWYFDAHSKDTVAVGGIYWYKIESRDIPGLTPQQINILNSQMGLTLIFGPSEITPQTNRQALNYDEKTIKSIKNKLQKIEAGISTKIQQDFDKCASIIEARRLWLQYFSYGGPAHSLGKILGNQTFKWKTFTISDDYIRFGTPDPKDKNTTIIIEGLTVKEYTSAWGRGGRRVSINEQVIKTSAREGNKLFINDLEGGRGIRRKMSYLIKTTEHNNHLAVLEFKTPEARAAFHALNGTDDSIFHSAAAIVVPKTESTSEGPNAKHKLKVFKYVRTNRYLYSASGYWEPCEVEVDEGGVYLDIYRFENSRHSNREIAAQLETLEKYNLLPKDFVLYGVKTTQATGKENPEILKQMQESDDWITYDKWFVEKRDSMIKNTPYEQVLIDAAQVSNIVLTELVRGSTTFPNSPVLSDYITKAKFIYAQCKLAEKYNQMLKDYSSLGGTYASTAINPTHNMINEKVKLYSVYPLLKKFGSVFYDDDKALVLRYVNTVDENLALKSAATPEIAA